MGLFWYVMYFNLFLFFFFFFSSRGRHTRLTCDWSSECALPISLGPLGGPAIFISLAPFHSKNTEPVWPYPWLVMTITLPLISRAAGASAASRKLPWLSLGKIGRASCRERV